MNDRSKKGKPPVPSEAAASDRAGERPSEQEGGRRRRVVQMKSKKSLERLRARVEEAARELTRLRAENERLADRIASLEGGGAGILHGIENDPEALERKIKGFIEAIDRYLEAEDNAAG